MTSGSQKNGIKYQLHELSSEGLTSYLLEDLGELFQGELHKLVIRTNGERMFVSDGYAIFEIPDYRDKFVIGSTILFQN